MLSGNLIPLPQIAYITAKTHRLQSANVPDWLFQDPIIVSTKVEKVKYDVFQFIYHDKTI